MTNPNSTEIVDEMILRLRDLQGSGEFPPLTRQITAGEGLEGGGTLEDDIEIRLPAATVQLLADLLDIDLEQLVDDPGLTAALAAYVTKEALPRRVVVRDFTVTDPPLATVSAPPIRVDENSTITRITVVVGWPGSQSVTATVAGETITVSAGSESATRVVSVPRTAGQIIPVSVAATSASGIVVSVRLEEDQTL